MHEPLNAWKKDDKGYFLEMVLGAKKDYAVDWSDFLPANEQIAGAVWTVPVAKLAVTDQVIAEAGKVCQAKIEALAVGEHACSVVVSTPTINQPLPFRVVVR